jgi:hypothetical protein
MAARDEDNGHSCSRTPPELCDGARIVVQGDGTSRREPARTYQAFCVPCRSRIVACLEELPGAYGRLADALGDAPVTGVSSVRVPFGPSEPIRAEIDALMRVIAAILPGWEARVRGSRLKLTSRDPARDQNTPESVKDAADTIGKHIDVLLALEPARMSRTFTFPFEKPGKTFAKGGAGKAPVPAEIEAEIGDEEIVRSGDGWVTVMPWRGGAAAGNEIIFLHYRARRHLGETKPPPESFDGIPCRACESMTLERAEPPSDPHVAANHSRCPGCGDEMDRETVAQWADTYASWARGAGIRKCKRCSLAEPKHGECSWAGCSCDEGEHPRRRAAA